MQRDSIYRTLPVLALVGTLGAPAGVTWAASKPAAKSLTFKGPTVEMRWGTVQVSIVVKSRKITTLKPVVYVHSGRSVFINEQALPILKTEVLQAQSGNIDGVSGATDTSDAYIESLQSAVNKARKVKALK